MDFSEDEEEVREDLPSDNEDNDEFYEHMLMQELEDEENVSHLFLREKAFVYSLILLRLCKYAVCPAGRGGKRGCWR